MTASPPARPPSARRHPTDTPRPGAPRPRPLLVTIAAGFLYFASVVWLVLGVTYDGPRGVWYPLHLFASAVTGAVAATGMLRMKRWSIILFGAFAASIQAGYLFTSLSNLEPLVWSTLVLLPGVFAYDRMS